MKNIIFSCLLIICVLSFVNCGDENPEASNTVEQSNTSDATQSVESNDENFEEKGKTVVKDFYEAIKTGNYENAINCVGDLGMQGSNPDTWIGILDGTYQAHGQVLNYTIDSSETQTNDQGTFYIYLTTVEYEKKTWKERVILYKADENGSLKIGGYKTNITE